MKKNILALSIQAMFGGYSGGLKVFGEFPEIHCRSVDYLPPGMKVALDNHVTPECAIKVRFRGAANSDDVMDFRLFLSPGNFPSGK